MLKKSLRKTLATVARFYDERKVGDVGALGFRRSTELSRLAACLEGLIEKKILDPGKTLFLDMGCADGRVNIFLSYLVKASIGIELDEWTLDEYKPMRKALESELHETRLFMPPNNVFLFHGDSMDLSLHDHVTRETGICFEEFDLFYTYLTMQDEFAGLIAHRAKRGALFMVYGLEKIIPTYRGLRLLTPDRTLHGILALYEKI